MEVEKQVKKQPLPLPPAAYKDTHTNGSKSPRHQPTASDKDLRSNEPRERSLSNGINPLYTPKRKCSTLHRESEISLEEYGPEFEHLEREKLAELKKKRSRNYVKKQPHPRTDTATATNSREDPQTTVPSKSQVKSEAANISSGSLAEQARAGLSVEELALLVISKAQQLNISMEERDSENETCGKSDHICEGGDAGDGGEGTVDYRTMTTEQITSMVNENAQNLNIDTHTTPTLAGGSHQDQNDSKRDETIGSSGKQDSPSARPQPSSQRHQNNGTDVSGDFMDDKELKVAISETIKSKSMRVAPSKQQGSNGQHSPRKPSSTSSSPQRVLHTYHGRPNTSSSKGSSSLCPPRHQPVANLSELGEFERRLLQAKMGRRVPMPDVSKILWYHPGISRHIAECLLLSPDMKDGTYLLRDSVTANDSLTVSARCQNSVKHYRVEWNGKQFCFGLGKFTTLDALIEHFDNQPMISGESGLLLQLSNPYPRGISEPAVYEYPSIVVHSELSVSEEPEKKRWSDRPHSWRKKEMESSNVSTNVVPPPLSINSKEGFLTKLGQHRKNWKRRWFVLYRNELKYFNSREDKEPLKTIYLDDVSAVEMDETSGKSNCFRLITSYRTFFMFADTPTEANDWVEILEWKINAMMSSSFQSQLSVAIAEKQF